MDNQLANQLLGKTVIYCDGLGTLKAAMIVNVITKENMDLQVWNSHGGGNAMALSVPYNPNDMGKPNTWWFRGD